MNARKKAVDKTYLSIDKAEERGFIHRDYIAHCLRWSHVIKRLGQGHAYKTARILDVGCGRELPLAKTLYSSKYIVEQYYGVDVGPINDSAIATFSSGKFPIKVWENTDVLKIGRDDVRVTETIENPHQDDSGMDDEVEEHGKMCNWVTMFEVAEHVEPAHLRKMLAHIKSLMTNDGTFFLSTPCWNKTDCAANHVNEMTYEALGAMLEREGWVVENVYGTFASIRDYEHLLDKHPLATEGTAAWSRCFNALREYYDTNFLSCVFAPLFPAQSRNCLWELRKLRKEEEPTKMRPRKLRFRPLELCQEPWGSSQHWRDMLA